MTRPLILLAAVLALTACEQAAPPAAPAPKEPSPIPAQTGDDVVVHLAARPELTTFSSALEAAGLLGVLHGAGPWTVLAPDNAAFDRIPVAERESLLQPENQAELRRRLAFHIVPGRLSLGEIARRAQMEEGGKLTLTTLEGGQVVLEDAGAGRWAVKDAGGGRAIITEGDEVAANGLIHRLDSSLKPG